MWLISISSNISSCQSLFIIWEGSWWYCQSPSASFEWFWDIVLFFSTKTIDPEKMEHSWKAILYETWRSILGHKVKLMSSLVNLNMCSTSQHLTPLVHLFIRLHHKRDNSHFFQSLCFLEIFKAFNIQLSLYCKSLLLCFLHGCNFTADALQELIIIPVQAHRHRPISQMCVCLTYKEAHMADIGIIWLLLGVISQHQWQANFEQCPAFLYRVELD